VPFIQPTYIIAVLIALSVHEWAHAFTAHKLGDATAQREGRLTLNPIAHIDPIGALMFLIVGFGWAKPVPVNPYAFRRLARDTALTALAGPFSNLVLAFVSFVILVVLQVHTGGIYGLLDVQSAGSPIMTIVAQIVGASLYVNLALMAFNLFPLAPLDGSKVLYIFLPDDWHHGYDQFMQYGQWILLFLVFGESLLPFPLLSAWVGGIMKAVFSLFDLLAGALF
jgi:Zn-dependent protease